MKFTVNVDCTPEEARRFFGLPDFKPMQDAMLQDMEKQMRDNMKAMNPEQIMQTWFPAGLQNFQELQKMVWDQMGAAMTAGMGSEDKSKKDK